MKIVAIIPVKSTSERVKSKNIKLLADKPLFIHTLDKLLNINEIDEVWIDTDDDYIIDIAKYYNYQSFKYFIRDKKLADNNTDGNKLLENEIKNINADIYLQVLCTSPFIKEKTIKKSIDIIINENYNSVTTIFDEKMYLWKEGKPCYDINNIPNSYTLENITKETMSLYAITKEEFEKTGTRIGLNPYLQKISLEESIDINTDEDFLLAQKIAKLNYLNKSNKLNLLKINLNSCILADILNDLGFPNLVLKNYKLNIKNKKLFGRVRPIQIRELENGEPINGIYNCLKSYESIIDNNIIFVNNKVENRAYFGDLNATISMAKNAQGTIINGFTRDINRTIDLNYPVFYKNNTCSDVKRYGTLDFFDEPINIDGINIYVNNLIFADTDGIVIIPRELENEVLQMCENIIVNETNISNSIILGKKPEDIIKEYGFF